MSAIATARIRSQAGAPIRDATLSGINVAILANGLLIVAVALLVGFFLKKRRTALS